MEINYEMLLAYFEKNFDTDSSIRKEIMSLKETKVTLRSIPKVFNSMYIISLGFIVCVEKMAQDAEVLQSADKKKAVVKYLEESIKFGFIAELFDGILIGMLIDQIVGLLNSELGHDWGDKISAILDTDIIAKIKSSPEPIS